MAIQSSSETLVHQLYAAFQRRDGKAMAELYSPEAFFSDPVFPNLVGIEIGEMWRMLCERSTDLEIEYQLVSVRGEEVVVNWQARYTFTGTGRRVHNRVTARIQFRDGAIVRHEDQFSFAKWAGQALGLSGVLLGWTNFLRSKVRSQAAASLARHRAS